jgi:hypothetical protein
MSSKSGYSEGLRKIIVTMQYRSVGWSRTRPLAPSGELSSSFTEEDKSLVLKMRSGSLPKRDETLEGYSKKTLKNARESRFRKGANTSEACPSWGSAVSLSVKRSSGSATPKTDGWIPTNGISGRGELDLVRWFLSVLSMRSMASLSCWVRFSGRKMRVPLPVLYRAQEVSRAEALLPVHTSSGAG